MTQARVFTIQLPPELGARLSALADRAGRRPTELAKEAIAEYLAVQEWQEWQVAAIEEAIREVEDGAPVVEHQMVARWLRSWGTDEELPCVVSGE